LVIANKKVFKDCLSCNNMKWGLTFLVRILGAVITSIGVMMTQQAPLQKSWIFGLFLVGLSLLAIPNIEK